MYMIKSTSEAGLPNNEKTQGMVTSLWLVGDSAGGYVGSSLGGLAYDKLGFEQGTLVESVIMATSVLLILMFAVWRHDRGKEEEKKEEEKEELLSSFDEDDDMKGIESN